MHLSENAKHAMRLCRKNQKEGGWCAVSAPVMTHIIPLVPEELMERETSADGSGRVRLTERGNTVLDYLF